jgi:hypothetical protein
VIVNYVIEWVDKRYKDDECLSIALFVVNNCLVNGNPRGSFLNYCISSVAHAIHAYLAEPKLSPLPPNIELKNKPHSEIPFHILAQDEQAVIHLRYERDMTIPEISNELGLTLTQTRYRLTTAHNKLRFYYVTRKKSTT